MTTLITPDQLYTYCVDVLGWSEEETSRLHPADIWEKLTPKQKQEAIEWSK